MALAVAGVVKTPSLAKLLEARRKTRCGASAGKGCIAPDMAIFVTANYLDQEVFKIQFFCKPSKHEVMRVYIGAVALLFGIGSFVMIDLRETYQKLAKKIRERNKPEDTAK
ncbi:hypothetical protein ACXHXG_19545 [Rhizobium sp. LEGMi198b]